MFIFKKNFGFCSPTHGLLNLCRCCLLFFICLTRLFMSLCFHTISYIISFMKPPTYSEWVIPCARSNTSNFGILKRQTLSESLNSSRSDVSIYPSKDLLLVLLAYYCIFRSVEMKAFLGSTAAEILEISHTHTHTQNKQKLVDIEESQILQG